MGKTAVNLIDVAISQDLTGGIVDTTRFVPEYVALHLQTERCQAMFDLRKRGATIKGIPREDVYEIEIAAPPLWEQHEIVAVLSNIQAAVEVQERIIATLREVKAASMAKLFREGLRGEPLKQTEIGEVPESWEVVACEAVCREITVGIVVTPAKYYVPAGVPCLRSFNVQEDRLLERDLVFISGAANDLHGKSKLSEGDVIIVRTGYPGTACVVPAKYDGANCVDLIIARPNHEQVLSDYLARFINSAEGRRQVMLVQGGLAQQHLNVGAFKRMRLALPPKEEQAAISRIGQALDRRIVIAEGALIAVRAGFSSMLHLLMTGQVRVKGMVLTAGEEARGKTEVERADALREKVKPFVAELVRRFEPERVVLFGQHAEGSPRAFGEVGLLVEMEFEGLARDQGARMAHEIPHDFSLDLVVRRPEDVARAVEMGDAFIKGVLERGRTLHVRPGGVPARREKAPRKETPPRRGRVSEETLRAIVQRIIETVQPERIILFGSAARGEMGPDSDVDLLVVKACADRRETARTISWHLIGVAPGLPKDVIVVTPEDVERDRDTIGLIIRPALREGRVVYAA